MDHQDRNDRNDREDEDMRRATFLRGGAAATAGLLLSPPPLRPVPGVAAPRLTEDRLMEAAVVTEGLRWRSWRDGSRRHIPNAIGHARRLATTYGCTPVGNGLRVPFALEVADVDYLVGQMLLKQAQPEDAVPWFQHAAFYARAGRDTDLEVLAITATAGAWSNAGKPKRALDLLHLERQHGELARFYVEIDRAIAWATSGDGYRALSALDRAEVAADNARHAQATPWLGREYELIAAQWRARCSVMVGRGAVVRELIDDNHRRENPLRLPSLAANLVLAADAALQAREPDRAASLLLEGFPGAWQTESVCTWRHGLRVRERIVTQAGRHLVGELDDWLRAHRALPEPPTTA